ncbi:MAG TPA: SpoIIE family protein phosphatase [Actinomycetota bacterium]|nr:SpoIIE family protein phosphatase [Actinomycetota bacterium]
MRESDFEDLYENAACAQISTTMKGLILRVNRAFLEWTGYAANDVVGEKRFSDLLTPGGRIYHETHYAPLLSMQGFAREIAVDVVAADGRRLPALVNAVVREDSDGEVVRIALFPAEDRREYERELMRARRRAEESEARGRALAQTLQASLIPPTPPQIPHLDVGAAFRPAGAGDEVGGDFYDVFEIAHGAWAVVIGDVRGKGAGAAAVTALARYTLRAAAMQAKEPHGILDLLNQAMIRQLGDTFCTVLFARVAPRDERSFEVTFSSGGHPLPVYVSGAGDAAFAGRPGTIIGVLDDPPLHDDTVVLEPEALLAFYTDGVTEGRRGGDLYGEGRLLGVLTEARSSDATEIAERLVADVVEYQGSLPRDDIAVVVLKVPGAPR